MFTLSRTPLQPSALLSTAPPGFRLRLVPCLFLAGLAACAPATTPTPEIGASFEGDVAPVTPLLEEPSHGYVSWDGKGRLDIAPPLEVLLEIKSRCQEMGFDIGHVTSISLEEKIVTAAFDCRGAS